KILLMKLKCVIVDDEQLSINILENHISKVPNIEVVATFNSALPLYSLLQGKDIDLLFLDIEMPKLSGIDFLKSINNPPQIIITTANKNYAIEGFELNVSDYLIKPISFQRLLKSVNRIFDTKKQISDNSTTNEHIYLNENKKMIKIKLNNILYLESIKDYVKVVTNRKVVTTKQKLNYFETLLNSSKFIRIHRSFIIAKNKIDAYSTSKIEINQTAFPIGRKYKDSVLRMLKE
nr:LytTR family DNA-binding domain-containing protein [Bacteroidales bacterium]